MKVSLSIKAPELHSSCNVNLELDPYLYDHAAKRITELAVELKKMNDKIEKEAQ